MPSFIRIFIGVFFVFCAMPPANAQFGDPRGIGDILEDILGQTSQVPIDALIDNIPVTIETEDTIGMTGKMLVVTAYAPAAPSGAFSKPDMLGQTQILLTGLKFPVNLIVAAPAPVTDTIKFARLDAKIIDSNGNPVLSTQNDGFFRGQDPVTLTMTRLSNPGNQTTQPPQPLVSVENIKGVARLSKKTDMFLGSTLTVQLVESGLAGGRTTTIAAESLIDLDQRKAPFTFTLERAVYAQADEKSYALKAWITDWAGRKSHVMERPVSYNGPDRDYSLTLDAYTMSPVPLTDMQALPSQIIVKGVARFDAYKGLPAGSRLTATLNRSVGAPGTNRAMITRTVLLDGLSGDVSFDLVADSTDFDPLIPAPTLNINITDSQGRLFFSAENVPTREGTNLIQLTPSAQY